MEFKPYHKRQFLQNKNIQIMDYVAKTVSVLAVISKNIRDIHSQQSSVQE